MSYIRTTLVAAVLATTALSTAVYAVEQKHSETTAAQQDFSKLSKDGFKAFQNVREARLAIFNGRPEDARKDVDNAMQALQSAKTDNTAFMKADADMKVTPTSKMASTDATKPDATKPDATKTDAAKTDASNASAPKQTSDATNKTMWLPINGAIAINEDFSASPAKVTGVKKANEQLKSGDHKAALETLKLNDVNVAVTIEAAPLNATIAGVDQASQLINQGKYYEANKALMGVENDIRFAMADDNETPKTANTAMQKTTTGAATTQQPAATPEKPASK